MSENKKVMPTGGAKGGTRFPLISLPKAIEYSTRLVSKTHTGPQPENIILTGVFDSATSTGKIRASALKQYGLLEGKASAYTASKLANDIVAAPLDEKSPLLAKALFKAKVFKTLFDTFNGDNVSTAKLRQKALAEGVHPDAADKCVTFFVESILVAQLGIASPEGVLIRPASEVKINKSTPQTAEGAEGTDTQPKTDTNGDGVSAASESGKPLKSEVPNRKKLGSQPFNIDLKLDATMDPEKLEKLMQVLTRYGAL